MQGKLLLLATAGTIFVSAAQAGISYTTPGAEYAEGFNSLPTNTRSSNSIESGASGSTVDYTDGWQDDVDYLTSPQSDVSVLGWHLHHETGLLPTSTEESGFNGHQRYRQGTGNSGTGAFYGFASTSVTNAEKALGVVTSGTLTPAGSRTFIGLELVNNTGVALNEFTVTYDGEQWRDAFNTAADPLEFAWAIGKTDFGGADPWHAGAGYSAVAALNFTGPTQVADGTVAFPDTGLDGNAIGNRADDITATITNVDWQPGQSLWLRWRDTNVGGNDDGLAIDDLRFSAVPVPEPTSLAMLGLGAAGLLARRRCARA